jgi:hypothetical protein
MNGNIGPSGGRGYVDWQAYKGSTNGSGSNSDNGGDGFKLIIFAIIFFTIIIAIDCDMSIGAAFIGAIFSVLGLILFFKILAKILTAKKEKTISEENTSSSEIYNKLNTVDTAAETATIFNTTHNNTQIKENSSDIKANLTKKQYNKYPLPRPKSEPSNIIKEKVIQERTINPIWENGKFLNFSHLTGTQYIKNYDALNKLKPNDKLKLIREPDNTYDSNAIFVTDQNDTKLGYIAPNDNIIASKLMDNGNNLFARVYSNKTLKSNLYIINIEIFIEI